MKYLRAILLSMFLLSCNESKKAPEENTQVVAAQKTETVAYQANGKEYRSYISYKNYNGKKLPVVLVIPEWWGLNDYAKKRADMLADLGYFALAVDYYGGGKTVDNPADAQKMSTPFYSDPVLSKTTFEAAKNQLSKFEAADASTVAVIGYCFGGAQALNMARQDATLKGAVSFHGNLRTGVKPTTNKVPLLVLHGAADTFVSKEEETAFRKEMDSAKTPYNFVSYPGAVHAFTNPAATEMGKKFNINIAYNKDADEKSWEEMKQFLNKVLR